MKDARWAHVAGVFRERERDVQSFIFKFTQMTLIVDEVPHPLDDYGLAHYRVWSPETREFREWTASTPYKNEVVETPKVLVRQRLVRKEACAAFKHVLFTLVPPSRPPSHVGLGHALWIEHGVLLHVRRRAMRPTIQLITPTKSAPFPFNSIAAQRILHKVLHVPYPPAESRSAHQTLESTSPG